MKFNWNSLKKKDPLNEMKSLARGSVEKEKEAQGLFSFLSELEVLYQDLDWGSSGFSSSVNSVQHNLGECYSHGDCYRRDLPLRTACCRNPLVSRSRQSGQVVATVFLVFANGISSFRSIFEQKPESLLCSLSKQLYHQHQKNSALLYSCGWWSDLSDIYSILLIHYIYPRVW